MMLITAAVIYGTLIFSVIGSDMSIGNFTLYLGLSMTFSYSLTGILNMLGDFKSTSMEVDNFRTFIDWKTEDEGDFLPVPQAEKYTFEFKNVSYKYQGAESYALKNLDLTFEAGKRLAVVGLNGAGKTTFIKLLLRLYDVTEGEILLNGTDIRQFRREDYYRLFAPVFQNVEIFDGDHSNEDVERLISQAGLSDKVNSLEKGADTILFKAFDENGIEPSGGEQQKIAIARALFKKSPVVILDEPTAALDPVAEYDIYRGFNDLVGGKTAIYISHRLSSCKFCDRIAVFSDGRIAEYGTHDELYDKEGRTYAEMFAAQAQYYQ